MISVRVNSEERTHLESQFALRGHRVRLTDEQVQLLLEPSEAPENFMMDGEIGLAQATALWQKRLRASGLSASQVQAATQFILKR